MSEAPTTTDLIINLPAVPNVATFTDEKEFDKLYSAILQKVEEHKPDVSTRKGRDEIASLAYKVARTKTTLDKQGKDLTEEWRTNTTKVNATRNIIKDRLEKLQATVRKPLDDWEEVERDRIDRLQASLDMLLHFISLSPGRATADLKQDRETVDGTVVDASWEEFEDRAQIAKTDALAALDRLITVAEKQEADARELEELRAAKVESDRIEAERLAAETALNRKREYAKSIIRHIKQCALGMIDGKTYPYVILFRELEEKITIDDALGDMAGDVETARKEALVSLRAAKKADDERFKAEQAQEEARVAEQARKEAEEASRAAIELAQRKAVEAEEQAAREIANAKAEAERRETAERQRIAAEKEAEAAEQRRRDADRDHRKSVNNAIAAELISCAGISEAKAKQIVVHLASGLVPNVTLKY